MILKTKLGTGFRGLDQYVTSKSDSRLLLSNMAGATCKERAREIAGLRSAKSDLRKAVGHLVLSHDPALPDLTDDEWRRAIDIARAEHDFRDAPFCAVLHNDTDHRHVHVFFCASVPMAASSATAIATARTTQRWYESTANWGCQQFNRSLLRRSRAIGSAPTTRRADRVVSIN